MTVEIGGILWRDTNVGRDLSPYLAMRLRWFLVDPRVAGSVWVVSGSRTFAQQLWLWTKWRAGVGGYNLAANPYRTIGVCQWATPAFVARGSWHMVQESADKQFAGAGAVDLGWSGIDTAAMHAVAAEYGIRFPLPTENWHAQAYTTHEIFEAEIMDPGKGPVMTIYGNADFQPIFADRDTLILWRALETAEDHNVHVRNRSTGRDKSYRVGRPGDVFADVETSDGVTFDVTVRRGAQEYHTVTVAQP